MIAYSTDTVIGRIDVYVCDSADCQGKVHNIRMTLNRIKKIEDLKTFKHLNINQLNIKESQTLQKSQNHLIEAIPKWEWVDDFGYWMSVTGDIKPIEQLEMQELQEAIVSIRKANISRITQRISWVRELEDIITHPRYEYPLETLKQKDIEEVYAKLEQFKEVYSP